MTLFSGQPFCLIVIILVRRHIPRVFISDSQPKIHPPVIRERLLNIILNDIIRGQIDHLIDALSKWPVTDVQALLMEIETDQKL